MKSLLDRIRLLIRTRSPLIALITWEEERLERHVGRMARDEELAVYCWRQTTGLTQNGVPVPDTNGLFEALQYLSGAVSEPSIFLFFDAHVMLAESKVVRALRDLEPVLGARSQGLILICPTLQVPRELEKDLLVMDVPLPDRSEVSRLLRVMLRQQSLELDPERFERFVQSSLGLTEKEVKRTYARILLAGQGFDDTALLELGRAKRQAIRRSRYLEFYEQVEDMSGVGGLTQLKEWLDRRGKAFGQEARDFGLPSPKGVFLLGVQGCGKSLTAKAVAGSFQIPLLRLDVGAVFQGGGRVEESLRDTIRIAESIAPAVLWIDELEKGFSGGTGGAAFGSFLTWLQEKTAPVFVVATANEVRGLPPELLRKGRFDEIFFVDLPSVHERLSILEIHLRRRKRNPEDFDLYQAAEETEKYSGAELEQVIIEAMFNAFAEGRELNNRDLTRVIRDTVPLAVTMDDRLKELREWAGPRTRPASQDRRRIDYFADFREIE
ncbi:MAG: hypothetical protein ACI9VR_004981 [Cognaticolwellia sp.]|jgi:hypothetical protein